MERAWSVYLVECADGTLYCGVSNDVDARLAAHNAGRGARYTRGRAPVRLVWREACGARGDALRRERQVKALPRAAKLALTRRAAPPRAPP
jgi:putative endonuclease